MALKLLFYTNAFSGGGAEIVFARLASALAADGHAVIFAADHAGGDLPHDEVHIDDRLRRIRLPPNHLAATRALAALLRRERPDASFSALGAHNLKHVAAAALAGRLDHCVIGVHGFAAAEPRPLSRLSFHATPLITRLAARTICVSDALRNEMIRRWHAAPARTLRIYNAAGIHARPVVPDAPPLVVACGRLVPIKRFPDLVAAFADVRPADARLAILGEGPERETIEAEVARRGLGHRVVLPGHVDPAPWYARASCLAVTSSSESFGLTVAEALAHGLPVVSTDCGGPREILDGGRYGTLVPVGDRRAIADALSRALAMPGDPAPRIAHAHAFSLAAIRDAYAGLAAELAGQDGDRDGPLDRTPTSSPANRSAQSR